MSFGLFRREGVNRDRTARTFRVLRVNGENVGAAGLKAADVEVGVRALHLGHDCQRVTVFRLEDERLR